MKTVIIMFVVLLLIIIILLSVRSEVETVKRKDPAIKSSIEVILYSSFWAMISHKIAHRFYKFHLFFIARLISQISRWFTGIEIHPGATIGHGVFIDHGMGVVIGETCEIGDNVLIYQNVTLGGTGKDIGKRHPTIESNVMVGAGAKVLGPIRIGHDSKIGAGSVVLKDIPPYSTVVGIPGRPVDRHDCTSPSDTLDQIKLPDPVEMEICKLRIQLEEMESEIKKLKKENSNESL
ncbi:MAG: serine O-acetyltransferase EpsC [Clostridia bacterium]|nr:serine O-acetyltransferase EpsC [Clostridia bacterium]